MALSFSLGRSPTMEDSKKFFLLRVSISAVRSECQCPLRLHSCSVYSVLVFRRRRRDSSCCRRLAGLQSAECRIVADWWTQLNLGGWLAAKLQSLRDSAGSCFTCPSPGRYGVPTYLSGPGLAFLSSALMATNRLDLAVAHWLRLHVSLQSRGSYVGRGSDSLIF